MQPLRIARRFAGVELRAVLHEGEPENRSIPLSAAAESGATLPAVTQRLRLLNMANAATEYAFSSGGPDQPAFPKVMRHQSEDVLAKFAANQPLAAAVSVALSLRHRVACAACIAPHCTWFGQPG